MDITLKMLSVAIPSDKIIDSHFDEFLSTSYSIESVVATGISSDNVRFNHNNVYIFPASQEKNIFPSWPRNAIWITTGEESSSASYTVANLGARNWLLLKDITVEQVYTLMTRKTYELHTYAERLSNAFFKGADLQKMTDILCGIIQRPIRIATPFYKILAQSLPEGSSLHGEWEEGRETGYLRNDEKAAQNYIIFRRRAEYAALPYREEPNSGVFSNNFYVFPLHRDQWFGWITVVEENSPCDSSEIGICWYFANLVIEALLRLGRYSNHFNMYGSDFVQYMIKEPNYDPNRVNRISRIVGIPQDYSYFLLMVAESGNQYLTETQLHLIMNQIQSHMSYDYASIFDGRLIVLFSPRQYKQIKRMNTTLKNILVLGNAVGIFSRQIYGIHGLPDAYQQAHSLFEYARNTSSSDKLICGEDMLLESIIKECAESKSMLGSLTDCQKILRSYDQVNGTNLNETLFALVRNSFRQKSTAQELFTHHSTIAYRQKRIEELLGISLQDYKSKVYVSLSYMVHEYLENAKNRKVIG